MNNIIIYFMSNINGQIKAIIDYCESVILNYKCNEIADCEIYFPLIDKKVLNTIQLGDFIRNGYGASDTWVVTSIDIDYSAEKGMYILVKGKNCITLLTQRIYRDQLITLTNNYEDLYDLLSYIVNYINNESYSQLGQLVLIYPNYVGDVGSLDYQFNYESYYDIIQNILTSKNIFWRMLYNPVDNEFRITYEEKGYDINNPSLIISENNNTLISFKKNTNTDDYCNAAIVLGEGEGNNKKVSFVYTDDFDSTNLDDRFYKVFDMDNIVTNEGAITESTYYEILNNKGKSLLKENALKNNIELEIDVSLYKFKKDFDIGDTARIILPIGETYNAFIKEVTEKWDVNGYICEPVLEIYNNNENNS